MGKWFYSLVVLSDNLHSPGVFKDPWTMLFTFNFWMFEMSENQKEFKALPALYNPELDFYLLRRAEISFLEQVALNNSPTFRLVQLSRHAKVGYTWDFEAVKTALHSGIIRKLKHGIYWCDVNHIREVVLKLEGIDYYTTGTAELPLLKLAKKAIDQGDYMLVPKCGGPNADVVRHGYIKGLMHKAKFIDLFTSFRHHCDRYIIVKPRAKEILETLSAVDSLIRISIANKERNDKKTLQDVLASRSAMQTVWHTKR
jgi:hypothetical protein